MGHYCEFQCAGLESGDDCIYWELVQHHVDARERLLKGDQHGWQNFYGWRGRVADVKFTGLSLRQRSDFLHGFVGTFQ